MATGVKTKRSTPPAYTDPLEVGTGYQQAVWLKMVNSARKGVPHKRKKSELRMITIRVQHTLETIAARERGETTVRLEGERYIYDFNRTITDASQKRFVVAVITKYRLLPINTKCPPPPKRELPKAGDMVQLTDVIKIYVEQVVQYRTYDGWTK